MRSDCSVSLYAGKLLNTRDKKNMKNRKFQAKPTIAKVNETKQEIEFTLTLKGTLNWNRDLAENLCGFLQTSHTGMLAGNDLQKALQSSISKYVFDRCENLFETARLSFDTPPTAEMQEKYNQYVAEVKGETKVDLEAEARVLEERLAKIKGKLQPT